MKKLINDPGCVVQDSLKGMEMAHGDILKVHYDPNFVRRVDSPISNKVALISGGGSGHEPLHGGFVGKGMLDAACPGDVFTSPTPDQMEAAAKVTAGEAGVLFLVKNYTGDVLNFEMAAEMCQSAGIKTASVVIDDDVAVKDSLYTQGRRGVGCTVIVEKVGGAAAEAGRNLDQVVSLCRRVNEQGRSMGMALTSCTVPAAGKPTFELGEKEIEMGVGIHGEPGRERMSLKSAREIVEMMGEAVVSDLSLTRGEKAIVLLNGMGGTPLIELYLLYAELEKFCQKRIGPGTIVRKLVGNYITSLEMQGFSLSMVRSDDEILSLWDAPVRTPALRWGC